MNKYYQALSMPTFLIFMGLISEFSWLRYSFLWLGFGAGSIWLIRKYISDEKVPIICWILLSLLGPLGGIALLASFWEEINKYISKFKIVKNEE